MSHRSPSRTRSHTPSCPEDPDETDGRRRNISQIQQDVERELENADRVLSTVESFTGSRSGSTRIRGDSVKRMNPAEDYRASEQGRKSNAVFNESGPRRSSKEECPRTASQNLAAEGGGRNMPNDYGRNIERGGYDAHDSGYVGTSSPYGQRPLHEGTHASGGGYVTSGGPGDFYGSSAAAGGGYVTSGGPGGPYGSSAAAGGGYVTSGGPGGPYGSSAAPGGGYGMPGELGDPYGSSAAAAGGYGAPGGPGGMYGSSAAAGGGYGTPGGPGGMYGSSAAAGGGYGSPGRAGITGAGMSQGFMENSPEDGGPASAVRSRDQTKGFDTERTAFGGPPNAANTPAYESRGKSPASVHYSPSTMQSARGGSPSGMQISETKSVFGGGRSPTGTQYSASRAPSQAGYDPSRDPSGYERGVSPTGMQYSPSKGQSDARSPYGEGMDAFGYEAGSRSSPAKGSRGSPSGPSRGVSPVEGGKTSPCGISRGASRNEGSKSSSCGPSRGPSPTDGSRTSGICSKEQSFMNNKICPAALHGKCPAFARDSSPVEQSRVRSGSLMSENKRPLTRIEETPPCEEIAGNEMFEQPANFTEKDFRLSSGGTRSQMLSENNGLSPYPSLAPQYEVSGQTNYDAIANDPFRSASSRSQAVGFAPSSMPTRFSASQHEHHHDHHDHDGEGYRGKPSQEKDEKATSALSHLSQIPKTPSYLKCKPDRGLDLSSCEKKPRETSKTVKFPEKPLKGIEELQELINCETRDVESAWYLTSDEKKTYKKPCPKQQKAQENVKSIVKAQTTQSCAKEYTPLEHPDPDDITPELAASMMFSQEQGVKLNECPDETIKRLFPDIPRPPFPVKLSAVHIIDPNQEDQEEMIEKSASVPSEGVSDSAYTRTMQNKGEEMGAQKSYDIDFAVGAEKREYVLVTEKLQRYNKVQFRGNLPTWFPGYMQAFPEDTPGIKLVESPSGVFQKAWANTNPDNLPSSDVIILE